MTIKYKFNKSSEARDCVVESVELVEIKEKKRLWKSYSLPFPYLKVPVPYHSFILEQNKNEEQPVKVETEYNKTFSSRQELKDYINTIQEPIEFIAESSIDDVLMKEWIGEWELSYNCNECNNRNLGYYDDCDYNLCGKKKVKTGSPKLNNNWTFKIE